MFLQNKSLFFAATNETTTRWHAAFSMLFLICSAGVGRTGCFIVIDAMMERIKHEKTVDIYGHVTLMRAQRNYMVQTEDQYVFIHDALQEAVNCGTTEVPARNLYAYIQKLTQIEGAENVTGMELEFKVQTGFMEPSVCPCFIDWAFSVQLPNSFHVLIRLSRQCGACGFLSSLLSWPARVTPHRINSPCLISPSHSSTFLGYRGLGLHKKRQTQVSLTTEPEGLEQ